MAFRPRDFKSLVSTSFTTRAGSVGLCQKEPQAASGLVRQQGQHETEGRSQARRALRRDAASVARHDALHQGQPHAASLEFAGGMQPLEHAEELVGVALVEAGSVVGNEILDLFLSLLAAYPDVRLRGPARELERVPEEIAPHLAEQRAVAARR